MEAAHAALLLLGHLRVHEATARRHPLHAARHEHALVAMVVAMAHAAIQHVGDRLEAAMRVIRKAGDVVFGLVRAELIEQQKRIEIRKLRLPDHARELHARPIGRRHPAHHAFDGASCNCIASHK